MSTASWMIVIAAIGLFMSLVLFVRRKSKRIAASDRATLRGRIAKLDLSEVTAKVKSEEGWDDERLWKAEREYRQLLYLFGSYPRMAFAPLSRDCDIVWHTHILDTLQYPKDCDRLFGRYIHHNPHMGTAQDEADDNTRKMREREFGTKHYESSSSGAACAVVVDSSPAVVSSGSGGGSGGFFGGGSTSSCGSSCSGGGSASSCGSSSCGGGGGCGGGGCGGS